ncbi:hypothetical protein RB653_009617 [Dictyostelium firmibasis]|uniref:Transglycosylase SLT domain-containing protein n=1 Tax=Dictyostelium firmibasis TaxID=79012 RepID=A0AAN7U5C0_9MYCE
MFKNISKSIGFLVAIIALVKGDTYTCSQMQSLTSNYFKGPTQTTMLCISYYESSYNTQAVNPSSQATGLFQILPEHCGELCKTCTTPSDLLDPTINTECAKSILSSQGFKAWTTYSSGDCNGWDTCVAPSASTTSNTAGPSTTHAASSGPSTTHGASSSGPSSSGPHSSGPSSSGPHSSTSSDGSQDSTSSNPTSSNPTSSNPTSSNPTSSDPTTYTGSSSSGMFDYKGNYGGRQNIIKYY